MMNPIAITGIACLFPGADDPRAFWEVLRRGERTTSDATADQLGGDPAAFHDPARLRSDTSYFLHGGYIARATLSPEGYSLPASTVADMGMAFRMALHTARAALTDGRYLDDDGGLMARYRARSGVIMGNLAMPTPHSNRLFTPVYQALFRKALADALDQPAPQRHDAPDSDTATLHGLSPGYPAAVVASAFGLGLGGFALDAACGSSLYAVGLAADYLNSGRADLMLAGAVSSADPLLMNLGFAHLGGFPASGGDSAPLDQRSGGLIAGEGAGLLVLKRYADAVRDGDHIYGLVRGVGLSNDGAGKHILTPNSKGQITAFRRAYADAQIDPCDVGYVECHASGTTVGDRTELASMAGFFSDPPRIGSVKSNVGHLMTAAGMASIIKLILAMAHDEIPPTIRVEQPLTSPDGLFDGGRIVTRAQHWPPDSAAPRIVAANAFGFGGVSAHLILSDSVVTRDERETVSNQPQHTQPARMAITGMGAHFGDFDTLDSFARALFDGRTAFRDLPANRWKGLEQHPDILRQFGLDTGRTRGAYIESFDLDFMAMRIPPTPADEPIPQQLILLKAADAAIRDAGLNAGANVAVIVALGTELALHQYRARADLNWQLRDLLNANAGLLPAEQEEELRRLLKDSLLTPAQVNHYTSYIGNIAASRVASLWDFSGPAYTVAAEENSVFKALEIAQMMFEKRQVDAVVIGAVDLAGSLENVLLRNRRAPLSTGDPVAGCDAESDGWLIGEGAGAVVLTRADAAGENAYAVIDALAFAGGGGVAPDALPATPDAAAVQSAARAALAQAGITAGDVGYLELHASGISAEDTAEIDGITAAYRIARAGDQPQTAIGAVKANIGHTYIASGMAALIKTALSVGHRFIPAIPNWRGPKKPESWADTAFWAATQSRTWFDERRVAAISSLSADGTAAHLVLSGVAETRRQPDYLRGGLPALVLIGGDSLDALTAQLSALKARISTDADLPALADAVFAEYSAASRYAVALIAKNADALRAEIDHALNGVPSALAAGEDWTTPAGSAFAAHPVGAGGKVAFVYPGAFNSYPKMGYELFHLFPHTLESLREIKSDLGEAVAERYLYPRSLTRPDARLTRTMKNAFAGDAVATIESGLSFALAYTRALRDVFDIQPSAAFGYSLGEGSMMWGMGAWRDGDAGSATFHDSRLFTDRLVPPMHAIREAWGIPADAPVESFWAAHFVAAPASRVKALVERESKVYLTHINTPQEVMIAGDPAACERVLAELDADSMKAPFSVVIHADVMMSEYREFYRLHDLPVTPVDGVDFYSAADYAPVKLERGVVAASLGRMACKPVDFAKLIGRVYDDGARVFLELGPRSTCARWVNETLAGYPHVAASIDNLSADSRTSLVRLLAALVAHRVPLNLAPLYHAPAPVNGRSLVRTVTLGGADVYAAIVGNAPAIIEGRASSVPQATPVAASSLPMPEAVHSVHGDFLRARAEGLQGLAELIRQQMATPAAHQPATVSPAQPQTPQLPPTPAPNPTPAPSVVAGHQPLYTYEQIETFALRRIADTFGERYAIYDGRRAPRIPNGDLLLISRVVSIEGERYKSGAGTSVLTEYDVPVDAWYYQDSPYPTMPYSVLMEIALQPCGILSAYHGPTFVYPDADLYFRNLDGDGTLIKDRDMRGRTITNRVAMLSHAAIGGSILQKYSFELYDGDELFYKGTAVFGYFTQESLASRAGLDAGTSRDRWIDTEQPANVISLRPQEIGDGYLRLGDGHLDLVHEIRVVPDGGHYGRGYAAARTDIDAGMWFFKNHFHEDPVMPGSIGVETMVEALQGFAIQTGLTAEMPDGHFGHTDSRVTDGGHKVAWRYRGQVLGTFRATHVEVNIKDIRRSADEIAIIADGSLWRENLRIYEVNDLSLVIRR